MATKDLKAFLVKIEKELSKNSKEYRKSISDKKVHTFSLSLDGLTKHVEYQLIIDGVTIPKTVLNKYTKEFFTEVKSAFMGKLTNVKIFERKATASDFYITFQSRSKVRGGDEYLDARVTFDAIKIIYASEKERFLEKIEKYYKKSKKDFNNSSFLHLGHEKESAVVKQRVQNTMNQLMQYGELPKSLKNLPEIEHLFTLVKDDDFDTISVTLESGSFNVHQGSSEEKAFKDKVNADLKKAVAKLDTLRQTSSDSAITRTRKKSIKAVTDPFKAIKGAVVTVENTKIKKSKKTPVVLSKKSKVERVPSKGSKKPKAISRRVAPKTTIDVKFLIGIFNQELPNTIANNMGDPRLNFQTGRFSRSVTVLDIAQTRQGFPSVGYTYQKNPYQVFENSSGSRFSGTERDPRALVDTSIREIAAKYGIGRLYTRRL